MKSVELSTIGTVGAQPFCALPAFRLDREANSP